MTADLFGIGTRRGTIGDVRAVKTSDAIHVDVTYRVSRATDGAAGAAQKGILESGWINKLGGWRDGDIASALVGVRWRKLAGKCRAVRGFGRPGCVARADRNLGRKGLRVRHPTIGYLGGAGHITCLARTGGRRKFNRDLIE